MHAVVEVLVLLGTPVALGVLVLRAIGVDPRADRLAAAAWAYLSGSLALGAVVAACLAAGLPATPGTAMALAGASAFAAAIAWPRLPPPAARAQATHGRAATWCFGLAVAAAVLLLGDVAASYRTVPVVFGDEAAIWAAKAKALFGAGGGGPSLAAALQRSLVAHADYPTLDPLLQAWAYWVRGDITLAFNRTPIEAMTIALVLAFAAAARRVARPGVAAILVLALAVLEPTLIGARDASADAMLAFGFLVAVDAWLRFTATRNVAWFRLCGLALAFGAWTKHEGAMLVAIAVLAVVVQRLTAPGTRLGLSARQVFGWLAPAVLVIAGTWWLNEALGLSNDVLGAPAEGSLAARIAAHASERTGPVLRWFAVAVFANSAATGFLPFAFAALLLAAPRRAFRAPLAALTWALLGALCAHALAFIGTPHDLQWHLATAASRLTFHVLPAMGVWVAVQLEAALAHEAHSATPEARAQ